jgi:hypothetical protein
LVLAQAPTPQPTVQPCTAVAVELTEAIDSATAKPGQFFKFETVHAVTDGGSFVVIPAKTAGYGIVALAVAAGRQGRPGSLLLEPLYLKLADGTKQGVVLNLGASGATGKGKDGEIPGYLGAIPIPGMGFLVGAVNYFRNGSNVTLPKGTPFSIYPDDDPKTAFCQPG